MHLVLPKGSSPPLPLCLALPWLRGLVWSCSSLSFLLWRSSVDTCGHLRWGRTVHFVSLRYGCCFMPLFLFSWAAPTLFTQLCFDATLGFPGEGPLTFHSHNVGSFLAHPDLLDCSAEVLLLQEARFSADNIRTRAQEANRQLTPGPLLPITTDVKGVRRVEWEGLAVLSQACVVYDFDVSKDVTGHLGPLLATGRVQASWAVFGRLRFLPINFYARPCLCVFVHACMQACGYVAS